MKIILLLGPSSAGKSTLCDALVKEHGWYTHGCDKVGEILARDRSSLLLAKLQEHGLIERLSPYMSGPAIIELTATGQFNLVHGDISIKHHFKNPDFPGLNTILSRAGFTGKELEDLTQLFHDVGDAFKELPTQDGLNRMLDDIFKLPPDASVIIDQVPPNEGDVKSMINDFREKIIERARLDGREIEFATVLAFCPPKALSARIHGRNEAATASGDLGNKREGMFPFLQLSQLISAAKTDDALDEARTLSKLQLLMIALQHLPPEIGEGQVKRAKAIFKAGAHEYRELMHRFRFSEVRNVSIRPREDLDAHAEIDLSQKVSPSELASELIAKTADAPALSNRSMGHSA